MKKIFVGLMLVLGMIGCTSSKVGKTESLAGKQYVLVQQGKDYQITLNFAEDNLFGFAGVNHYFGKYQLDGNKLVVGSAGSTMMAGPQEAMTAEQNFLSQLGKAKTYEVTETGLIITTETGEKLEFKLVEAPKPAQK